MEFRRNDALFPDVPSASAGDVDVTRPVVTLPGTAMDAAVRIACLPPPAQIEEIARIVQNTLDVAQATFASQLAEQIGLRERRRRAVTPVAAPVPARPAKKPRRQGNS